MTHSCIRINADLVQISRCKALLSEKSLKVDKISSVYSLLGNKVRLQICYLLYQENELCVCDLSDILNMTIPAISQHLKKLKDSRIVTLRKESPTYFYYLKPEILPLIENVFNQINSKVITNI